MTNTPAGTDVLNIVVPMAGQGSRFRDAGYSVPKPVIPVRGVPMIEVVIRNLRPRRPHRFIFITLREIVQNHEVDKLLNSLCPNCTIHFLDEVTQGAACTVLTVRRLIDTASPLMIANCDQWVDADVNSYLDHLDATDSDGLIMTMWADDPKWSYVRLDERGTPTEVVEKRVVSNEATVGIYNFRHGHDFVTAAEEMIAHDLRVNGEFYVAPTYNHLLKRSKRVALFNVGAEWSGMYGLGTPADLQKFEELDVATRATRIVSDRP